VEKDTAHIEIMTAINELKIGQSLANEKLSGIDQHLVTLNSKVATQEAKIGAMQLRDARNDGKAEGASKTISIFWTVVTTLLLAGGFQFIEHLISTKTTT
jgi:hypothetical protein